LRSIGTTKGSTIFWAHTNGQTFYVTLPKRNKAEKVKSTGAHTGLVERLRNMVHVQPFFSICYVPNYNLPGYKRAMVEDTWFKTTGPYAKVYREHNA
jgi:hypothetical protein